MTSKMPRPNTPEWLAAMELVSPRRAELTRMAIDGAGRADACSVCGDTPVEEHDLPPGSGPPTIFLCADCFRIQNKRA